MFEHRDRRLDRLGNPLLELDAHIDWEAFRPLLDKVRLKERKSSAGRKPWDVILMFKGLVLASLYSLSDEQLEFQIEDRRRFQRFIGLSDAKHAPDRNSFWLFRESLKELKLTETLFNEFNRQLDRAGLIARKGQLIDASFVKAPVQRNTPEENDRIKSGEVVEGGSESKRQQKDTDARWTQQGDKSYYGYKNHVNVDNAHKLIRKYAVTDASVHDSQRLETLLDAGNTSRAVWADSAYRSAAAEASLKAQGYRSRIHRKGVRGKAVRSIGLARAEVRIGFMNLVYNMRRFCALQRVTAS
ncbi:IS5 family transposase [Methylomicrobium sp. RS1]|nr:IS5 family transposase [Methylomicrobium sp. RS1]